MNMTDDAHARPTSEVEGPLYDPEVPTPTHGERARSMVSQLGTGTLCTIAEQPAGFPYGSLVTAAFLGSEPVFLLSELAEHTKNLKLDCRASLLMAETAASDPLANGRVTLLGSCERVADDDTKPTREAFLKAHPAAAYYVDFRDFGFWNLHVESIRYIGGYGRMSWVSQEDWTLATVDPLADRAAGIISHMNADHAETMVTMCRAFSRATDTISATMTGVDRYGFEMSATTAAGPRPIRLAFPEAVASSDETRKAIVAMYRRAQEKIGK
ncbi:MAG: DUF2470 domain-containing protein [Polyangiaceae bacterium]|nr:DUF2470 domain-containing protein [Polyangiaceae bacterium]